MAYQRPRASSGSLPMSLEASLDEENREVLATLGRDGSKNIRPRGVTPPPVRSMLDVESSAPRHGSIAGIGVGITSLREQRKPSRRLDPSDPSTWTAPHTPSSSARQSVESFARSQDSLPRAQVDVGMDRKGRERRNSPFSTNESVNVVHGTREHRRSSPVSSIGRPKSVETPKTPPGHQRSTSDGSSVPLILTPETKHAPAIALTESNSEQESKKLLSHQSLHSQGASEVLSGKLGTLQVDHDDAIDQPSEEDEDEEDQVSTSDDELDVDRGRQRTKYSSDAAEQHGANNDDNQGDEDIDDNNQDSFAPQSRGVRSLLDPVTESSKASAATASVGFGRSGPTAADFEDDSMEADIQKAKSLGLSISPVDDSITDRHVRMVIRGDWAKIQLENANSNHTSRLYLACTDLSTEASHSLEWTIGTMLRDGDTLLAIYAIEDENAPKEPEGNRDVIAESAKAAHDASETMNVLTRQTTGLDKQLPKAVAKFLPVTEAPTSTGSVDARSTSKKEMERLRAMDEITQNFLKLVRKTSLQIRCMIEVIHCKSPKHLILNAIDELEPTLCVVGTRGRSSLKGVLLGSFSNYLVTKSSVPVMVARRRKKKPRHAKVNSASIRLSNNLTSSLLPRQKRGLQNARID